MKVAAAAVLAAMLVVTPLHAQAPATAYDRAVAARQSGDAAEAVRLLEPIVAAESANADAQVQLGYAYLALGRLAEAERAFSAALEAAPDYADARLGLARIAQRRGDRPGALRALEPVDPGNAEAAVLRAQIEQDTEGWRWALDLDGAYAFVDGAQPDWQEGAIQLRRRASNRATLAGRLELSRRFGLTDVYGELLADLAVGSRGRAYVLVGGTPDADFRPEWQIGAGGSLRASGGRNPTILTLDLRQAEFAAGDVQTVTPGIEQYLLGGRAWLTARWINTFDTGGRHLSGYLVRGDVQALERLRLFAGFSNAPDTSEGAVVDTRSYFGGLSTDFDGGLTLRLSAAHDDSDTGADRTQIGLGLGWRF